MRKAKLLSIIICVASATFAQWHLCGPDICSIQVLTMASINDQIWIGADSGLYSISINSNTWKVQGSYFPGCPIRYICKFNSMIFAGGDSLIWCSRDSGKTWNISTKSDSGSHIFSLSATKSAIFYGNVKGLYRSIDTGAHWSHIIAGSGQYGNIVVCSDTKVFYHELEMDSRWSDNNGDSWIINNNPIATYNSFSFSDSVLYSAREKGIYRSSDAGVTWQLVLSSATNGPFWIIRGEGQLALAKSDSGYYYSQDKGEVWKKVTMPKNADLSIYEPQILLLSPEGTLVASPTGIYSLTRDFSHVEKIPVLLKKAPIYDIRYLPHKKYLCAKTWLSYSRYPGFRSLDCGKTWTQSYRFENAENDKYLFSGATDGCYRSGDEGTTWEHADSGISYTSPGNTIIKTVDDIVALKGVLFASPSFRSDNNGDSWTTMTIGCNGITVCNNAIFQFNGTHLLKSQDTGKTFNDVFYNGGMYSITSIAASKNSFFITDGQKVFRLPPDFNSFAQVSNGLPPVTPMTINRYDGTLLGLLYSHDALWLPIAGKGVYCSIDEGNLWNLVSPFPTDVALPSNGIPHPICTDSLNLYFCGRNGGLLSASFNDLLNPDAVFSRQNSILEYFSPRIIYSAKEPSLLYSLPARSVVKIKVYTIDGKLKRVFCDTYQEQGAYRFVLNAGEHPNSPLAHGNYLLVCQVNGKSFDKIIRYF